MNTRIGSESNLEELLTVSEVAALLKVPVSWIYCHTRKRSKASLPYLKVGKYLRFYESDVRRFLNEQTKRCA
jgi:excisionase family DNA binding protein